MNAATTSVVERATIAQVLNLVGISSSADPAKLVTCPLHDDGTPSFRIYTRGWRCFGCDRRGGILDLVVALGFADDRADAARFLEESIR